MTQQRLILVLTSATVLVLAVVLLWTLWWRPRAVRREAERAISEFVKSNPPRERPSGSGIGEAPVFTAEVVHAADGFRLPIRWVSKARPKPGYAVVLCGATDGKTVGAVSLVGADAVFASPPQGVFVLKDESELVLFGWHCIYSDGNGNLTSGTSPEVEGVAATMTVGVTLRFELIGPKPVGESKGAQVTWSCAEERSFPHITGNFGADFQRELPARLPNLRLTLLLTSREYAFDTGFDCELDPPDEGQVVTIRLKKLGKLLARIVEMQPGDFVKEIRRQAEAAPSRDGTFRIVCDVQPNKNESGDFGKTPGGVVSFTLSEAELERIGSGNQAIEIPFAPPDRELECRVSVGFTSTAATCRIVLLNGVTEQSCNLTAVNRGWEIKAKVVDVTGKPLEGVSLEFAPGIWLNRERGIASSFGSAISVSSDAHGIAVARGLPLVSGAYVQVRISSGERATDFPRILDSPEAPGVSDINVVIGSGQGVLSRFILKDDDLQLQQPDWRKYQIQVSVIGQDDSGVFNARDWPVTIGENGSLTVQGIPAGDYFLVLKGPFGLAGFRVRLPASDGAVLELKKARVVRFRLLGTDGPSRGAVIVPAPLPPPVAWAVCRSGTDSLLSLGQCLTDENGEASMVICGEAKPRDWSFWHQDLGVFTVSSFEPTEPNVYVFSGLQSVPSGSVRFSYSKIGDSVLRPSFLHVAPVFKETSRGVTLDLAWGAKESFLGAEVVLARMPAGRYWCLPMLSDSSGVVRLGNSDAWQQSFDIAVGKIGEVSLPRK